MPSSSDPPPPPIASVIKPRGTMRQVMTGLAVVLFCVWAVHPAMVAYTFQWGEKATATVTECEPGADGPASRRDPDVCRGTWRTESGKTGEGEIYNLDAATAEGRTFPVRIGPVGPYAHGWERAWSTPATVAVLLLVFWFICYFGYRVVVRPSQRRAAELAAEPGALIVAADGVFNADGTRHASVDTRKDPPPGHRGVDVPGRPANDGDQVMLGRKKEKRLYKTLKDADGRPLMFLELRSDRDLQPETVVSDAGGVPYLLVRRQGQNPLDHLLVDASGGRVGTVKPVQPKSLREMTVRDAAGAPAVSAARRHGHWVLRPAEGAAPELRDAAIAVLLARAHDFD